MEFNAKHKIIKKLYWLSRLDNADAIAKSRQMAEQVPLILYEIGCWKEHVASTDGCGTVFCINSFFHLGWWLFDVQGGFWHISTCRNRFFE